jgi:hypothetical protein
VQEFRQKWLDRDCIKAEREGVVTARATNRGIGRDGGMDGRTDGG